VKPIPVLVSLAAYNIVQNTLLRKRGYVIGNLAATGIALSWARRSGLEWDDLGMDPKHLAKGIALGTLASAAASGSAVAVRNHQTVQTVLDDERLRGLASGEIRYRLMVRFPLGTALFEEVLFRGVLPAVFRHQASARADLISAGAFAAWHVIPAARAVASNSKGRSLSRNRKTILVLAGSAAAGLAGLSLSTMRRASSSLAAPWMTHATFNVLAFLKAIRS